MKKTFVYFLLTFMPIASAIAAVSFPGGERDIKPFSQHGLIQNVQNYSSNPFWNSDSAYNQRLPVPIYAQGTALTAQDCQSVVSTLIAAQCVARNNCTNTTLDEIRPDLMVQLSKLPKHNYVAACAGFIDTAFQQHVAKYGVMQGRANFPTPLMPGDNQGTPQIQIENPYENLLYESPSGEEWMKEMIERGIELEMLQRQSSGNQTYNLTPTQMPGTIDDLSFQDKLANKTQGYEKYADTKAYQEIEIESTEKYLARQLANETLRRQIAEEEKRGNDTTNDTDNTDTTVLDMDLFAHIQQILKEAKK